MDRVRIGIIGAGGIFRGAHLPAYPKVAEARIVALADVSEKSLKASLKRLRKVYEEAAETAEKNGDLERAKELREIAGDVRLYRSYEEMLEKEEPDLVDVCTPHKFHAPAAIAALKAGCHVMVEKPMARTYLEALEIVEAVKEARRFYQHNENWVYLNAWYTLRKIISSGVIGELQIIYTSAAHGGPEWSEWFWDPDIGGGGSLLDMGVHSIGAVWYAVGFDAKPAVVKATRTKGISIKIRERRIAGIERSISVEDDGHILIRFERGDGSWSTAHVEGSWSYRDAPEFLAAGTDGMIKVERREDGAYLVVLDSFQNPRRIRIREDWGESFTREIASMCRSVLNSRRPLLNEEIGAEISAIIDAAYYSELNGRRPVTLEEFKKYVLSLREKFGNRASQKFIEMKTKHLTGY